MITEEVSEHDIFIAEAATSAVVDTACAIAVAGESWFINYCKKLDNDLLTEMKFIHPKHHSNSGMVEKFSHFKGCNSSSNCKSLMRNCQGQYSVIIE